MTKERAKQVLPVIQAWVEGKVIQYKRPDLGSVWRDAIGTNGWDFDYAEWRIKPTPRTGRMCLTCQTHFHIHDSEQTHTVHCRKPDVVQWVEVVQ